MESLGNHKLLGNCLRKMVSQILDQKMKDGVIRCRHNKKLYLETEGVVELKKKRRLQFYGRLLKMNRQSGEKNLLVFQLTKAVPN